MSNLYELLGVKRNASQKDILKAYRGLAKKYHPDISGGNDDKFKLIAEAYSILSQAEKRKEYDKSIHNPGTQSETTIISSIAQHFVTASVVGVLIVYTFIFMFIAALTGMSFISEILVIISFYVVKKRHKFF